MKSGEEDVQRFFSILNRFQSETKRSVLRRAVVRWALSVKTKASNLLQRDPVQNLEKDIEEARDIAVHEANRADRLTEELFTLRRAFQQHEDTLFAKSWGFGSEGDMPTQLLSLERETPELGRYQILLSESIAVIGSQRDELHQKHCKSLARAKNLCFSFSTI